MTLEIVGAIVYIHPLCEEDLESRHLHEGKSEVPLVRLRYIVAYESAHFNRTGCFSGLPHVQAGAAELRIDRQRTTVSDFARNGGVFRVKIFFPL